MMNKGLYAIADSSILSNEELLEKVDIVLKNGAAILQYRDKSGIFKHAVEIKKLCNQHNIPLIINDNLQLAKQLDADGVHLGKDDGDLKSAREFLGANKIIGISCYNDLNRALEMQNMGATYIAFGAFFSSNTKPLAIKADLELLKEAKKSLSIPIVCIGGITLENADQLISNGANYIAVIQGLFKANDLAKTTQQFSKKFN
jgi:thiamine-phosphate pyrophosphorylase